MPKYASVTQLLSLVICVLLVGIATSDGSPHNGHASEVSSHHLSRNFLDSLALGPRSDTSLHADTKQGWEATTQDSAIPFWMEGGIPRIRVAVGTPPQVVELIVDTGSGLTWVHGKTFASNRSLTWKPNSQVATFTYLDSTGCSVKVGFEQITLTGQTLSNVLMGVSDQVSEIPSGSTECSQFSAGILGLDRSSGVLKAFLSQRPSNLSNVFSFAFKDDSTGDGENLFSLGGYAGLNPSDVVWLPHRGGKEKDNSFRIRVPYLIFKNKKWSFPKEHTAVVDTGCSYGTLPGKVLSKVFAKEPGFKKYHVLDGGGVVKHYFNSSAYEGGQVPVMALGMEGSEWLTDVADATSDFPLNFANGSVIGRFYSPTFFPTTDQPFPVDPKLIPSIIGASFLNRLKGLVFDFNPGFEKVGFIPRYEPTTKSGLKNPLFGPRARSIAGKWEIKPVYITIGLAITSLYRQLF